jgi:hypothetical protein
MTLVWWPVVTGKAPAARGVGEVLRGMPNLKKNCVGMELTEAGETAAML